MFRVLGLGSRISGVGFQVPGFGFQVSGIGWVSGPGFRALVGFRGWEFVV